MLRASVVGVAGKRLEVNKDEKKGSPQAQAGRGNDFAVKGRYRRQHINFWPVAIEAGGAICQKRP
jgi:hypothetical protein